MKIMRRLISNTINRKEVPPPPTSHPSMEQFERKLVWRVLAPDHDVKRLVLKLRLSVSNKLRNLTPQNTIIDWGKE